MPDFRVKVCNKIADTSLPRTKSAILVVKLIKLLLTYVILLYVCGKIKLCVCVCHATFFFVFLLLVNVKRI